MALALLVTALLLAFVLVLVWQVWDSALETRLLALAFAVMSVGALGWFWMCQYWRALFVKCQQRSSQSRLQLQRRLPIQPNRRSCRYWPTFSVQSRELLDAGVRLVITPVELGTATGVAVILDWFQMTEVVLQNIVHTYLVFGATFEKVWSGLSHSVLSEFPRNQACPYLSKLQIGNREPIVTASWQSETLVKRLYGKWSTPLIPRLFAERNFWNQKNSSASYARLSPANPIRQETVEKAGKVSLPFLSTLDVLLRQGDGVCGLALWLPASAFSFPASLIHLKRYVVFLEQFPLGGTVASCPNVRIQRRAPTHLPMKTTPWRESAEMTC